MRRRILITLLASTSIVLIAFLVPLMVIVGDLAVDRAQRHVVLEVQPLVSRIPVTDPAELDALVAMFAEQTGRQITLYLPDGTVIGAPRPADDAVDLASERGAFFAEVPGGRDLLVPVYTDDGEAVLRAFVPDGELTAAVPAARLTLLALGAALLAASVGLGLLLARAFLTPIRDLAATADRLAGGDMAARAPRSGIAELDAAGSALNRMSERVVELLHAAREDVADLAHRLRTPVAALRLDAETIPEGAAAERLQADLDTLTRTVDDVIREARRPLREDRPAECDLCAVARERAQFWGLLAEEEGRALALDVPNLSLHVRVDPRDLGDALDALIGNVMAHTDEGVAFQVAVSADATGPWLEVSDDGPGLPDAGVLERGRSASGSTGLGLDIARRVAERSGGSLQLGTTPTGGARVRLNLSAAA